MAKLVSASSVLSCVLDLKAAGRGEVIWLLRFYFDGFNFNIIET